jgi:hypothetical protein
MSKGIGEGLEPQLSIPPGYVDEVFDRISKMTLELDDDPLEFGPKRLNLKVSQARSHLSDCENIYLEVSRLLQRFKSAHRTLETEFEIEKKHLFANDPEVRSLPHVTDREALATMKLRKQVREMEVVARNIPDLESLIIIIKAKRSDLKDLQSRIRDQIKLCQEEIGLGAKWGSKPPPGSSPVSLDESPKVPRQTIKELRDMFGDSDSPDITDPSLISPDLFSSQDSSTEPDPSSPPGDSGVPGAETEKYLDEIFDSIETTPKPSHSKSDLESLLNDLDI